MPRPRARAANHAAPRVPGAPADHSGRALSGRYRLLRRIGQRVTLYQARRLSLGEPVLIRVLPGDPTGEAAQRFLQEAGAAARLHHGHIIRTMDYGIDHLADGRPVAYVAMEYLRGENLTATMAKEGPLHWTRVLVIARQVCRALIAAHGRGVVHGDITPTKCFRVARRATPDFIKLLDFGVSGADDGGGRRPVMSCPSDDLRALGVLMVRLLTGCGPGPHPASLQQALSRLDIPPTLAALVRATLDPEPGRRPASARVMYQALVAVEVAPTPPPAPSRREAPAEVATPAELLAPTIAPTRVAEPCPAELPVPTLRPSSERQYGALYHLGGGHGLLGRELGAGAPAATLPEAHPDGLPWPLWAVWVAAALMVVQVALQLH